MKWVPKFLRSKINKSDECWYGIYCPSALQIPLHLTDFSFLRAIGYGYASTVFEVIHHPTKIHCVLKICVKTRHETKYIAREIQIHSKLQHPHILAFYAAFQDAKAFYIVLEYAPLGDLRSYCKNRMHDTNAFLHIIFRPLLHALCYLHALGIIHRDIKPENILFDHRGKIRLADFGLSIDAHRDLPHSIVGTIEYMAPELLQPQRPMAYTDRIDTWSIGVLFYECITGRSPFYASTDSETTKNILRGNWSPVGIKDPIQLDFLHQCFIVNPSERPSIQMLLQHDLFHPTIPGSGTKRSFSIL